MLPRLYVGEIEVGVRNILEVKCMNRENYPVAFLSVTLRSAAIPALHIDVCETTCIT
jgi:hypothetical protein